MALNAGEVACLLVIKNRRIIRVEEAEGTEGNVAPLTDEQKQIYSQSSYGCRRVATILETDTQSPNSCFIIIGGFKVKVPCS
jgi:hypothetical protein